MAYGNLVYEIVVYGNITTFDLVDFSVIENNVNRT